MEKHQSEKPKARSGKPKSLDINVDHGPLTPRSPLTIAGYLIGIALISLLLGLIIRGYIAYSEGVFFEKDLREKIPLRAKQQLEEYDLFRKERESEIQKIDQLLTGLLKDPANSNQITSLMEVREHLRQETKQIEPPIKLQPFYLSDTMFLWPWLFMCFGWIILLLRPPEVSLKQTFSKFHILATLTLLLFVLYRWPTWLRNFALGEEAQKVFAAANYAISPTYFYTQEVIVLIVCFLLAVIWRQWALYNSALIREQASVHAGVPNPVDRILDIRVVDRLSEIFIRWQLCSLVLALAFLLYTNVFWQYVVRYKDQRYIVSAIIIHAFWGLTWGIISVPMLRAWYDWYLTRSEAISKIAQDPSASKTSSDTALKAIQEISPIPIWSIAGSSITAIVTFLLPLVNAFRG